MNLDEQRFSTLINYSAGPLINVGSGEDITIRDLAHIVQQIVQEKGTFQWDTTKPDGTPQRKLDMQRLHGLGWNSSIVLEQGIKSTYEWYQQHQNVTELVES